MTYKRTFFEKEQPIHIVSRAMEEKRILDDEFDCLRFIFQCYAANIGSPAFSLKKDDILKTAQALLLGEEIPSRLIKKEHAPLVHILDFSLVGNHYHFYLTANIENSIPLYMQKLNGGFGKYFNLKYGKKGPVFESRYKSVIVKTDFQSDAVSRYVSVINPLDVYQPGWRENGLKDIEKPFDFLRNYKFSSFPDKINERNSKIIAPKEILEKYTLSIDKEKYIVYVKDFLTQKSVKYNNFFIE